MLAPRRLLRSGLAAGAVERWGAACRGRPQLARYLRHVHGSTYELSTPILVQQPHRFLV